MASLGRFDPFTVGPKLWTCFLLRRYQCDLEALNVQLTRPLEPDEVFKFAASTEPYAVSNRQNVFESFYKFEANPDCNYSLEPYARNPFNLYQQVVKRVPECKHWLLKDWGPYFAVDCPHVDISAEIFTRLSEELDCCLVDRQVFHAWQKTDPDGLKRAEAITFSALVDCHLPEIIPFICSAVHLAIWNNVGAQRSNEANESLQDMLHQALRCFSKSPVFDQADDGWWISKEIPHLGALVIGPLEQSGIRSMPEDESKIPSIANNIVLVKRCQDTEKAMRILHAGGDMRFDGTMAELLLPTAKFPSPNELADAAEVLLQSANDVQLHLKQRAVDNLKISDQITS